MKYPFIIFYRKEKFKNVDNFFIENSANLDCTVFLANCIDNINFLHNSNFHLLITYGDSVDEFKNELLTVVSKEMLIRHLHILPESSILSNVNEFNKTVNIIYVNLCSQDRILTRPTFSLFTPSFNSFNKILRVYKSLQNQTLNDWEWIIIDDSPDDKNFEFLRNNFSDDQRIRFYRRSNNNGSIGNVKNETIGLCRGKYVLEMDHDDELLPYVLQESADLFNKDPELGFIYYDCACVYENGQNQWYGDDICKGYGGYYSQIYEGNWRLVYITPNINNITMSHLVCCPNHPRIWRRTTLLEMGSYCEYLPICDDYEIIVKTSVSTKIAKVHKIGYIQYMNDSNNNFSLIRNAEINRIGPYYISPIYYDKFSIHEKMKEKNAYEDEKYIYQYSRIWERDQTTYQHKYCNLIINNDYDKQFCIIGLDSLIHELDRIKELYENPRNDFIILENKGTLSYLQERIERYNFKRMKCYSLQDISNEKLINYFKLLYLSVNDYEIISISDFDKPKFNTKLNTRAQIINTYSNNTDNYLEIGVEYGDTFNTVHFNEKVGVDPDPKFTPTIGEVCKLTSDDYFKEYFEINNNLNNNDNNNNNNDDNNNDKFSIIQKLFDVVFIDGMHQADFVLKDINNTIKVLSKNGTIFIDDILPFNYNEQLKVPLKHYYENNILKYGENWTGDVWKVIYYILMNYKDNLSSFNYYYNSNFRGIALFKIKEYFQIEEFAIDEINNFDYFKDYKNYIHLLENFELTN